MLESVIEDQQVDFGMIGEQLEASAVAVRVLAMGNPGEATAEQVKLIVPPLVGSVPAAEDPRVPPQAQPLAGEFLDHRRLSGAAGNDVANGEHRTVEAQWPLSRPDPTPVTPAIESDDGAIKALERAEENPWERQRSATG